MYVLPKQNSTGGKMRKPCVKIKTSDELGFIETNRWRCPQSLSELVSLRDWKHPWGAWKSLISSGAKKRKPCVKIKTSNEP